MTAGERLIEQGRQQGLKEARQRIQAILLRQLRHRFGEAVNAQVEERVAMASPEQVDCWCLRVVDAATLTEVLAD